MKQTIVYMFIVRVTDSLGIGEFPYKINMLRFSGYAFLFCFVTGFLCWGAPPPPGFGYTFKIVSTMFKVSNLVDTL